MAAVAAKSYNGKSILTTPLASIQELTADPRDEDDLTSLPTMPHSGAMNNLLAEDADLEQDKGSEQSDPLLGRHLPNIGEAALIEENDIQRAVTQVRTETKKDTNPSPFSLRSGSLRLSIFYFGKIPRRMRIALIVFVIVAVLALILDSALVFIDVTRHPSNTVASNTASTSTLTPGMKQTTVVTSTATTGSQPAGTGSPVPGAPPLSPSNTPGSGTPVSSSPVQDVAPLSFQFTATQGQSNPPGQQIIIGNSGNSAFYWQVSVNSSSSSWLSVMPANGSVVAGQSITAQVNVNAAGLTSGSYNGQITISATGASGMQVQGSPQTALVTLQVLQPCTLQEAPASLSFTVSLLQPNAPGQNIAFQEVGNCARPVTWTASVNAGSRSWLTLSVTSGSDNGNGSTIGVNVNAQGKLLGSYTGQITLKVTDSNGVLAQGSPKYIAVTLNVIA